MMRAMTGPRTAGAVLPLLLLLLLPAWALAWPEPVVIDLSCDSITKMEILSIANECGFFEGPQGFHQLLIVMLTPEAARTANRLEASAPVYYARHKGEFWQWPYIDATANGRPLPEAPPKWANVNSKGIGFIIFKLDDAFKLARAICPDLAPDTAREIVDCD